MKKQKYKNIIKKKQTNLMNYNNNSQSNDTFVIRILQDSNSTTFHVGNRPQTQTQNPNNNA